MTSLEPSPFTLARRLRAYAEARQRHNLLAKEIHAEHRLSNSDAALYFHRISSGVPRCQHQPNLCTNDGEFAVSSDHDDLLNIACRHHLQTMAPTRCELVASLGEDLVRYAVSLQELQRQIRNKPNLASTHQLELLDINRRLRPNNHYSNPECPYHPRNRP